MHARLLRMYVQCITFVVVEDCVRATRPRRRHGHSSRVCRVTCIQHPIVHFMTPTPTRPDRGLGRGHTQPLAGSGAVREQGLT